MKKGLSGFTSLILVTFIFLIAVAIFILISGVAEFKIDSLFSAASDILKGQAPEVS